jgi:hypothetical protein
LPTSKVELVFDCETNGLLDRPDLKVHCIVAQDVETEEVWRFADEPFGKNWNVQGSLRVGLEALAQADLLIGHNISGFDIPLLDRIFPGWRKPGLGQWFDTSLVSNQVYPGNLIIAMSAKFRNANGGRSEKKREEIYPRRLLSIRGAHSLEAWGYRMRMQKGDYLKEFGVQEECSKELIDYCEQDVRVNRAVYLRQRQHGANWNEPAMPMEAAICESQFGYLMHIQQENGVGFDEKAATELYGKLAGRRAELETELQRDYFPDWWAPKRAMKGDFTNDLGGVTKKGDAAYVIPKRTYKVQYPHQYAGRQAGCPYTPIEKKTFNANADVADRLIKLYGWEPKEFTDKTAEPKVDDEILSSLTYPCIPLVRECLVVLKRLGQISEGKKAWLKFVKQGKIHGRVKPSGTRTSRCSHSNPNLAQVPKNKSPYGKECRSLFRPTRPGWVQVGTDASGIELRMLGNRMAYYDGGALAKIILHGDVHEEWRQATGMFYRENQKTGSYAFLYGAWDERLGLIVLMDWREALEKGLTEKVPPTNDHAVLIGEQFRRSLMARTPGLDSLVEDCHRAYKRGWLLNIDGRVIRVLLKHGSVNDLLQGDAGVCMKYAAVIRSEELGKHGWLHGVDYAHMLNVHDEWQDETPAENAEQFGMISVQAIKTAGEMLKLHIPLDGEYKVGGNWCETH